jgi:hypothetical protein
MVDIVEDIQRFFEDVVKTPFCLYKIGINNLAIEFKCLRVLNLDHKPIVLGGQSHSKVILFEFSLEVFKCLLLFINHNFM